MAIRLSAFLLLILMCPATLWAQIREDDVDFEVLATITFQKDNTLWKMAEQYYGDPQLWPLIAYTNRISDGKAIPVGTVIYIPTKEGKRIESGSSRKIRELQEKLSLIDAELKAMNAKNEELAGTLLERDAAIEELEKEKSAVMSQIEGLQAEIKRAEDHQKASEAENEKLQQMLKDMSEDADKREIALKEMMEVKAAQNESKPAAVEEIPASDSRRGHGGKLRIGLIVVAATTYLLSLSRIFGAS